jgi:tellurite resistance protein
MIRMHPVVAREGSGPTSLLGRLQSMFGRVGETATAYAGDERLMQAFVAAAANVIVADGEVASQEFDAAIQGMRANPILEKGYDGHMLEEALYDAIGRARTRSGRIENVRRMAAIADRPLAQRHDVFLTAADVADFEGISAIEDRALAEIAATLDVDRTALLDMRAGLGSAPR